MPRVTSLLMAIAALVCAAPAPAAQPNILLLVAEDLSPRIGAYGDSVAVTPNIDRLAARGTLFTNVFTTAGVCAPSRAALVSGQHQISFGGQHMRSSTGPLGPYLAQPPAELRAFPELLRQAGYFTFTDTKLDYQFSGIRAGSGPFTLWDREGAADVAWREREAGQPFFGLINFIETHESGVMRPDGEPHSEVHRQTQGFRNQLGLVAAETTDPADVRLPPYYPDLPAVRRDLARHYDNIHAMDARVGRILAALAEDGLERNTIIIWTSDHGDGLPRAKRELYDSGIRVPMIVLQPGEKVPDINHNLVSFVDLAPSILELAGIEPPPYLHGQSIFSGPSRTYIYASRDRIDEIPDRQRAVRGPRFKFIRSWHPELPGGHELAYRDNLDMVRAWRTANERGELNPVQQRWFRPAGREQLYDLVLDPFETNNLAAAESHDGVRKRMAAALDAFLARVGDTSAVDEAVMRDRLLDDGVIPTTPPVQFSSEDGALHIVSPIGASIGYRYPGETHWRLYTSPLRNVAVEARSVRYGWQAGEIQNYAP